MNNKKILISIGLSLLLIGCGSDSNSDITSKKQNISVPNKIDVKTPKVLKGESTDSATSKIQKTELQSGNSRGYLQLKENIAETEFMKNDLKINLLLAEKIMPQIQEECQDIPTGTTCNIEAGKLTFVLNNTLIREIGDITGEIPSKVLTKEQEKTLKLGKTSFTQYTQSKEHQYALVMNMTPIENSFGSTVKESIQTIKWSKDENNVWSTYSTKDNSSHSSMSLRYLKKDNGEVEMEIDDDYNAVSVESMVSTPVNGDPDTSEHKTSDISGKFNFKIINSDENFKVTSSSSDYENGERIHTTSSIGEISDKGGYLSFRGFFFNTEYREKEQFDAKGNVVSSIYCDSAQECSLNDESTWIKADTQGTSEPIPTLEESTFVELIVTGGNLEEGQTLLLKPDTNIDKFTMDEVFNSVVGEVYVSEDELFGILNSKDYINQLDKLIMVHLDFDIEENTFKEPTFELVSAEDRPTLSKK